MSGAGRAAPFGVSIRYLQKRCAAPKPHSRQQAWQARAPRGVFHLLPGSGCRPTCGGPPSCHEQALARDCPRTLTRSGPPRRTPASAGPSRLRMRRANTCRTTLLPGLADASAVVPVGRSLAFVQPNRQASGRWPVPVASARCSPPEMPPEPLTAQPCARERLPAHALAAHPGPPLQTRVNSPRQPSLLRRPTPGPALRVHGQTTLARLSHACPCTGRRPNSPRIKMMSYTPHVCCVLRNTGRRGMLNRCGTSGLIPASMCGKRCFPRE